MRIEARRQRELEEGRCSSEEQELKENLARDYWIKCWDECSSSDSLVDGGDDGSHCDSGADVRCKFTGNSGVQDTGRLTAGTRATGRRATDIGKMGATMAVMARGANTMGTTAGIRVTGIRVVGVERTSVTTITMNRNGSLTHSLRL